MTDSTTAISYKHTEKNTSPLDITQLQKNIVSYINSLKKIIELKIELSKNSEISDIINNINSTVDTIINEKNSDLISQYESTLKHNEQTIRILYGNLLNEKLLREILEEKIMVLLQKQTEYKLVKEKTGVFVSDGKIVCNERKDNEILILRTENSTLKNVINDKENQINKLNEKINEINNELKKFTKSNTNINININDNVNRPASISKKMSHTNNGQCITINKSSNKKIFFNTIYSPPNCYSQKDININNFNSTTKNFYKSYHMNSKLFQKIKNIKHLDESRESNIQMKSITPINHNNKNNTSIENSKLISVNKTKSICNNNSRNHFIKKKNKNSSCENIPMTNNNNHNYSVINNNNNGTRILLQKRSQPIHEFNSYKILNTKRTNKEQKEYSTNVNNACKNNINSGAPLYTSRKKENGTKNNERNSLKIKNGVISGKCNSGVKRKKFIKNEGSGSKKNFNTVFQKTSADGFKKNNI